ncbi:MAG: hypothetical protein ACQETR_10640 [Thermodesulfobacteriota bacterium]
MQTRYIPEDRFPMQVLGNYYFNLMLITGKEKPLLFEAGVSGIQFIWWINTTMPPRPNIKNRMVKVS